MKESSIYLDNNSTTPLDPRVLEEMMPYFTDLYGNPSSSHKLGRQVKLAIDKARGAVGELINSNPEDVIFTAGATEAINIAIRGVLQIKNSKPHIITVNTEHHAVLDTCRYLEQNGVDVTYLSVDKDGFIDFEELKQAFKQNTVLVSVMWVNNETGVIQPIKEIAQIVHDNGALFMCDATQALGKISVDVLEEEIDLLAFSGHKFYGPKGVGGLYLNPRLTLKPLIYGGGHERGLRSGTLNTAGIVGLGKAAAIAELEMASDSLRISKYAKILEKSLLQIEDTHVNGSITDRLYNTINIRFEGIDNQDLLINLNNICVANGSACSSFTIEPSHVLLGMGLSREQANSSIRFSLGRFNTEEEIQTTIKAVVSNVSMLRKQYY